MTYSQWLIGNQTDKKFFSLKTNFCFFLSLHTATLPFAGRLKCRRIFAGRLRCAHIRCHSLSGEIHHSACQVQYLCEYLISATYTELRLDKTVLKRLSLLDRLWVAKLIVLAKLICQTTRTVQLSFMRTSKSTKTSDFLPISQTVSGFFSDFGTSSKRHSHVRQSIRFLDAPVGLCLSQLSTGVHQLLD